MTKVEKLVASRLLHETDSPGQPQDDIEIGRLSTSRSRMASEIGAAMAHELNGPMTALLLYVGDIHQRKNRIADLGGDNQALQRVIDNAFREAERVCALLDRMGDYFEAPVAKETAIPVAREAIARWSRMGHPDGGPRSDAGDHPADPGDRSGSRPLTRREREVLRLVSAGFSNKEGAIQLKISYRTFECHRAEVMRKFGAKNTAELVRLALLPEPSGT